MLKRCKDTNLALNWEKSHFMMKEGIVLGHKIWKKGIEVDKAKIDIHQRLFKDLSTHDPSLREKHSFYLLRRLHSSLSNIEKEVNRSSNSHCSELGQPFEIMCDASDYAIGAVLGQRIEKHFRPIHYASKTMTEAESNYTTTEKEMLAVVYAFEKFRSYLIMKLMGAKTMQQSPLRLKPYENVFDPKEINETFPLETLNTVTSHDDQNTPWFADIANYHAGNFLIKGMFNQQKGSFFKGFLSMKDPSGAIIMLNITARGKVFDDGFFWPTNYKDAYELIKSCMQSKRQGKKFTRDECSKLQILQVL
ncbi:reverse transcriptase domain-containing protein [Tanacetum coccineum]